MHRARQSLHINTSRACLLKNKLAKLNCSLNINTNTNNDNEEARPPSTPVPPSCRLHRIYEEKLEVLGSIGYENWFDDNANPFYRHEPPALELPPPAPESRSNHTNAIPAPIPFNLTAQASAIASVTPATMAEKTMEQSTFVNGPLRPITFGQTQNIMTESTPNNVACITPLQTPTAIQAKVNTDTILSTSSTDIRRPFAQESNKFLPITNGLASIQLSERGAGNRQDSDFSKSGAAGHAAEKKTIASTTTPVDDDDFSKKMEMVGETRLFSFDSDAKDSDRGEPEEDNRGFHDYTRGFFNHTNIANAAPLTPSNMPTGRSPEMDTPKVAFVTPEVPTTSNPKGMTLERLQRRLSNRNRIMDRGQLLPDTTVFYSPSPVLQAPLRFGAGAGSAGKFLWC